MRIFIPSKGRAQTCITHNLFIDEDGRVNKNVTFMLHDYEADAYKNFLRLDESQIIRIMDPNTSLSYSRNLALNAMKDSDEPFWLIDDDMYPIKYTENGKTKKVEDHYQFLLDVTNGVVTNPELSDVALLGFHRSRMVYYFDNKDGSPEYVKGRDTYCCVCFTGMKRLAEKNVHYRETKLCEDVDIIMQILSLGLQTAMYTKAYIEYKIMGNVGHTEGGLHDVYCSQDVTDIYNSMVRNWGPDFIQLKRTRAHNISLYCNKSKMIKYYKNNPPIDQIPEWIS